MKAPRPGSSPLTGADWFLATAGRMMLAAGQGEHIGLTVLRLGPGLDLAALRSAAAQLAAASPIAAAQLRKPLFRLPCWVWQADACPAFPVEEHREPLEELCARRLNEPSSAAARFDVLADAHGATLVLRWRHVMLDAKGAELLLAEVARLAENAGSVACGAGSWGPIAPRPNNWWTAFREVRRFNDSYYACARMSVRSLGGLPPRSGAAAFFVEKFSAAETAKISARSATGTHELFRLGWFLAAAMRMHHAVLTWRGETAESYQANCPVQERKRGARQPIWQNHVNQLFFQLLQSEIGDMGMAAHALREQFMAQTRARLDQAFAITSRLLRRAPAWFYLRVLREGSNGHISSFFFSHTGEFLPECRSFCGAPIADGWHVPSVCQPPGTGVFFSQRDARLTATISWREGTLREGELELMRAQLRADLLGP